MLVWYQAGRRRLTPDLAEVSVTRLEPSMRAVAMFPSPSTKTIRLASGDQAASDTAVGNVIFLSPMVTTLVPFEMSTSPACKCCTGAGAVGVAVGVDVGVAAGVA